MAEFRLIHDKFDIRLGFHEGALGWMGFWLTIEDLENGAEELEDYIFHNMRDVEDNAMTLEEIEGVLADFGVTLPYDVAYMLVIEGRDGEYLEYFEEHDDVGDKRVDFEEFYRRVCSQPDELWEPLGDEPPSEYKVIHSRFFKDTPPEDEVER